MEIRAPGVQISVSGSGIPAINEVSPAQYFAVGLYEWGPVNTPIFTAGLDDFRMTFGDNVAYSAAPEHFEAAYYESNATLSGWITRVFEVRGAKSGQVAVETVPTDTKLFVSNIATLQIGDVIHVNNSSSAGQYTVVSVNIAGNYVTLDKPIGFAAQENDDWFVNKRSLDEYRAKCKVMRKDGNTLDFMLVALDPGAKGNTFCIEIAPDALNPASDVRVRVHGRYKNFDFFWKGVGTAPEEVPAPGVNSTPEEQARYNNYQFALRAHKLSAEKAQADNEDTYNAINLLADQRQIDFRMVINDNEDFSGNLKLTQERILNTKISANAIYFYGGMNGESIDNAGVFVSNDVLRTITPYKLMIGDFDYTSEYTGIQSLNNESYGTGALSVPGYDRSEIWDAIVEHCETFNRLGLGNIPRNTSPQNAALQKMEYGGSKNFAMYFGYSKKNDIWVANTAIAAGIGSRETARQDADGGIKAAWTGRATVQAVEQFYGRDAVDDGVAELFSRADVGLNYVRRVMGVGYRLDSQRLSLPQGAISRVYHIVVNNAIVYSIKPAVVFMRDRTIDRDGALVSDFINTMDAFFSDYRSGRPAPRGNTLWNPAVVFDATSLSDLRNQTLRMHIQYSQSPKAERIIIGIEQQPVTL